MPLNKEQYMRRLLTEVNNKIKSKFNSSLSYDVKIENRKVSLHKVVNCEFKETYIIESKMAEMTDMLKVLRAVVSDL